MTHTGRILSIDARITPEEIASLSDATWLSQENAHDTAREMAVAMNRYMRPEALFQWFDIAGIGESTIAIENPVTQEQATLTTGSFSPYFEKATRILCALYTLGPKVDRLLAQCTRDGDAMGANFINMGSLAALSRTASVLTQLAENRAKNEGIGVSPPLSPGSIDGWELSGQRELCKLFPLETIGVTLGENAILAPMNTLSVVIAIGPGFTDTRTGSPCRLCRMGGSCTLTCSNHRASSAHKSA